MAEHDVDLFEVCKNNFARLEGIFSSPPFLKPSIDLVDDQKVVELRIGSASLCSKNLPLFPCLVLFLTVLLFAADDIDIDEPLFVSSSSEMMSKNDTKGTPNLLLW